MTRTPRTVPLALVFLGAVTACHRDAPPPAVSSQPGHASSPGVHEAPPSPVATCDETLPPPAVDPTPAETVASPSPPQNFARHAAPGAILPHGFSVSRGTFAGSVFDRGAAVLKSGVRLVIPDNASVAYGAPSGMVEVFMEKVLAYVGHPATPITAASVRAMMGVATHPDGDDLLLATFGEWDSHIEGGAGLLLFVRVPAGTSVVHRRGYSGDPTPATTWPPGEKGSDAARVLPGWTVVAVRPDPQRIARAATPPPRPFRGPFLDPGPAESDVKRAVLCAAARRRGELTKTCEADAPKAPGWFEVVYDLRVDGTVRSANVFVGTLKDSPFASCVSREIGRWTFAKGATGTFIERFEVDGGGRGAATM